MDAICDFYSDDAVARDEYSTGNLSIRGKGSWEFEALEKYVCFRYSLLPYLYSTAWQVSKNSDTFMRALFMDYPQDSKVLDMDNQYMFGRSLLVAPVTQPMYVGKNRLVNIQDTHSTNVYLPDRPQLV